MKNSYKAIGVMSGSSMDGIDIALVNFEKKDNWEFEFISGDTFPYSNNWKNKLLNANRLNIFEFLELHREYGLYVGKLILSFIEDYDIDLIASHGHTIFHQPHKGITFQIGDGYSIAALTGKTVVSDFRSMDVALGGQGAPMVPVGDMYLFNNYDYCINLGGFANISFNNFGKQIAFDICPVNTAINFYANKENMEFDRDGKIAKKGKINKQLLTELNNIQFYNSSTPKSLGREWLNKLFLPIVEKHQLSNEDKLRTIYEHIAIQIALSATFSKKSKILITGGGAYNNFLIKLIRKRINHRIIIPEDNIVDYKEAIIFAFLGILRLRDEYNSLSSVTGAKKDSICGITHRT